MCIHCMSLYDGREGWSKTLLGHQIMLKAKMNYITFIIPVLVAAGCHIDIAEEVHIWQPRDQN